MRTFIALEIGEETRSALKSATKAIGRLPGVRWANPDTIHLTLRFIGELKDALVPEVLRVMENAAKEFAPPRFAVKGLGWFPAGRRPRVLWAGVEEESEILAGVVRRLDEGLEKIGISSDAKPYRPHLTLGRARGHLDIAAVENAFERIGASVFGEETAYEMVLFMSELSPGGAVHTRMGAAGFRRSSEEDG